MTTPITQKAKQKGEFPVNQEVTMNADGSGGPINLSPLKQTSEYEKYKSTAASRFPNSFNVDKDSMIVTYHGNEMTSKRYNTSEASIGKKKGLIKSVSPSDQKTEYNGKLYRQSNVYPKTSKQVTAHGKHAEKTNS